MKKATIIISMFIVAVTSLFSQTLPVADARYFNARMVPTSPERSLTLSTAQNIVASNTLNAEIERLGTRGGVIIISNGGGTRTRTIYLQNIVMKSNIHIKVHPNVTIRPLPRRGGQSTFVFLFGHDGVAIRNVALTSTDENGRKFKARMVGGIAARVRFVQCIAVSNFKVSDINITDDNTVGSNVELNLRGNGLLNGRRNGIDFPHKGLVQNITSIRNHVGYGVVQIRAGKDIKFENLDGGGGVTLRIETGFSSGVRSIASTVDRILGRNITIRDGDAALQLAPHRVNQGVVDVRGIKAFESSWAVQIDGGFLDRKPTQGGLADDNEGVFSSRSIIRDITEVRPGRNKSQIKRKDFQFLPCNIGLPLETRYVRNTRPSDRNPDNESTSGPSIGVVRDSSHPTNNCLGGVRGGCYRVRLTLPPASAIKGPNRNILQATRVFTIRRSHILCANASNLRRRLLDDSVITLEGANEEGTNLYPNPADDILNVESSKEVVGVDIYNASGQIVVQNNELGVIDISNLESGIYFVNLKIAEGSDVIKKLVVN